VGKMPPHELGIGTISHGILPTLQTTNYKLQTKKDLVEPGWLNPDFNWLSES